MRLVTTILFALTAFGVAAAETPLISSSAGDSPAGVAQFGRFAGTWRCAPRHLDKDGNWQDIDARPTWVWHYILNGNAVQDIWIPDPDKAPPSAVMGTNLRVYDPEANSWDMVWATETLHGFQHFTAQEIDGNMVMRGEIPAGARPAHLASITFHNISAEHFDWKYEASAPNDGENWQAFSMLACDRMS